MLLVVAVHVSQYSGTPSGSIDRLWWQFARMGWIGVSLFFVVTAANGVSSISGNYHGHGRWVLSRYVRLAPTYIMGLVLFGAYSYSIIPFVIYHGRRVASVYSVYSACSTI